MDFQEKSEQEARQIILEAVASYYHTFKESKKSFVPGDPIKYAGRVFDEKEMCALTETVLDFWLTAGRYAERFERGFAQWLGVKFSSLTCSGSSANLLAFFTLTASELGERRIRRGDVKGRKNVWNYRLTG